MKMTGEICLFYKYGFCKHGDKCNKSHLREVCPKRECDSRKCDKRHPRPCKLMMENGFCKFGTKCSYSHRLPKIIEDQNLKIEALERMIENQNETINDLKFKMLENPVPSGAPLARHEALWNCARKRMLHPSHPHFIQTYAQKYKYKYKCK